MKTLDHADYAETVRRVLPYDIRVSYTGYVTIANLKGEELTFTRAEIEKQLEREDLDVHRRRMYEAALEAVR